MTGAEHALPRTDLVAPSFDAVRLTFGALGRTATDVTGRCADIEKTLALVAETLGPLTHATGPLESGSLGLVGLPVLAAVKAARSVISEYVRQQTGRPLDQWLSLVQDARGQFKAFVARLNQVVELGERYAIAGAAIDREQAGTDLAFVEEVRVETGAWKLMLSGVAQLAHVVEAILQVDLHAVLPASSDASAEGPAAMLGGAFNRIKDAGARAMDRTTDVREWLLRSVMDIRDRVRRLPSQVQELTHEVALLEVLLELQVASLRVHEGSYSADRAEVVGRRIATMVRLPVLAAALADAEDRARTARVRGDRLLAAREAGLVDEAVYRCLDAEYHAAFDQAETDRLSHSAEVDAWRADGPAILAACQEWVAFELRLASARSLAEQPKQPDPREALLRREQQRLVDVQALLAAL